MTRCSIIIHFRNRMTPAPSCISLTYLGRMDVMAADTHLRASPLSFVAVCPPPFPAWSSQGTMPTADEVVQLQLPVVYFSVNVGQKAGCSMCASQPWQLHRRGPVSFCPCFWVAKEVTQPFIVNKGLAPVSVKLLATILHNEVLNMAELPRHMMRPNAGARWADLQQGTVGPIRAQSAKFPSSSAVCSVLALIRQQWVASVRINWTSP